MLFNDGQRQRNTVTVLAGTGSHTFIEFGQRKLVHFYINPTSETTVYSWKYIDKHGVTLIDEQDITGTRVILNTDDLPAFTYGNFTISIYNSNTDEDFVILPVFNEEI